MNNLTQSAAQHDAEHFNVGDILEAPWGFSVSGVDFYQVVRITASGKSVALKKLAKRHKGVGQLNGNSEPIQHKFVGEALMRRVKPYDATSPQVRIDGFTIATRWTGVPFFESHDQ